jgi:hypothetical protein
LRLEHLGFAPDLCGDFAGEMKDEGQVAQNAFGRLANWAPRCTALGSSLRNPLVWVTSLFDLNHHACLSLSVVAEDRGCPALGNPHARGTKPKTIEVKAISRKWVAACRG